jgi:hypothetical protein
MAHSNCGVYPATWRIYAVECGWQGVPTLAMTNVFISHATSDRELVETAIVTLLMRQEISTSDLAASTTISTPGRKTGTAFFATGHALKVSMTTSADSATSYVRLPVARRF